MAGYRRAKQRRSPWEGLWRDCYEFTLPQLEPFGQGAAAGRRGDRLFDATAADAVDRLAANLLAQLTPPWSRWFGLAPGRAVPERDRLEIGRVLDQAAERMLYHFDRSNFSVEIHQCYLDLAIAGTACLAFEEAPPGEASAFKFSAVPMSDAAVDEGPSGRLDTVYRENRMTKAQIATRFPRFVLPEALERQAKDDPDSRFTAIEAVIPEATGFVYAAALMEAGDTGQFLAEGRYASSPFIAFRWLKAPGESYGRSPVMKALPDIKTANKIVELVLKNASIAVTGIWQAEDDGVLNPANIRLVPGAIIPKAVGSAGLTPLEAPGRFDVSDHMLEQLKARIRQALLADQMAPIESPRMTATEVLKRSAEMTQLLGATFGRLQAELLTPLVRRAMAILSRRGEIDPIVLDGHEVDLQHRSPLARAQMRFDADTTVSWIELVRSFGPEAQQALDPAAAARWLGRSLGVPDPLIRAEARRG
ncbi:MAG: phage tail protein [Alphaproteobacteria bacterium]|nr:phage tail protein [Alphaproteobacteria bacterium]